MINGYRKNTNVSNKNDEKKCLYLSYLDFH